MQTNNDKPIILEVFKGEKGSGGKIIPIRRVGKCLFYQCTGTHIIHIDLFQSRTHRFYLKPPFDKSDGDFRICIKEPMSTDPSRHVFRQVGAARVCDIPNDDLVSLEWDFVGFAGIYMRTISVQDQQEKVAA